MLMSATSSTSALQNIIDGKEEYEHYIIKDGDLAIILQKDSQNVSVFWPNSGQVSGLDVLGLYALIVKFELTIRDSLKTLTNIEDVDLDFFRTNIIDESTFMGHKFSNGETEH